MKIPVKNKFFSLESEKVACSLREIGTHAKCIIDLNSLRLIASSLLEYIDLLYIATLKNIYVCVHVHAYTYVCV